MEMCVNEAMAKIERQVFYTKINLLASIAFKNRVRDLNIDALCAQIILNIGKFEISLINISPYTQRESDRIRAALERHLQGLQLKRFLSILRECEEDSRVKDMIDTIIDRTRVENPDLYNEMRESAIIGMYHFMTLQNVDEIEKRLRKFQPFNEDEVAKIQYHLKVSIDSSKDRQYLSGVLSECMEKE